MNHSLQRSFSVVTFITLFLSTFLSYLPGSTTSYLSGHIMNQAGHSVPYVILRNITQDYYQLSDEQGTFVLHNVVHGDTIKIGRYGYQSKVFVVDSFRTDINFLLSREKIRSEEITVTEKRSAGNQYFTKLGQVQSQNYSDNKQIFSQLPGSYVKSYGGTAGISTVSMNGAESRFTKIEVEGINLTNSQNGTIDISQLPSKFIKNIAYSTSGKKDFSGKNSEGVIKIEPWQNKNTLSFGSGSFGKWESSATVYLKGENQNFNLLIGKKHVDGDYKVKNPFTGKIKKRKNNNFDQEYLAFQYKNIFSSQIFLKALYLFSKQDRGVAGQIWSPTYNSYRQDYINLAGVKLGWVNELGNGKILTNLRKSKDQFYQYSNHNINKVSTYSTEVEQNFNILSKLSSSLDLQMNKDFINSDQAGDHERISYSSTGELKWQNDDFTISPSINYSNSPHLYSKNTWQMDFVFRPGIYFLENFFFTTGNYFHYPSFNDLYWEPGGNENLKPEYTDNYTLGFTFNLLSKSDLKIHLYKKVSENLIRWLPSRSYWIPKNVKKSVRKGGKLTFSYRIPELPIKFNLNYNYTSGKNKTKNRKLRYFPSHSGNLSVNYIGDIFQVGYQLSYTGQRIAMHGYPANTVLDSFLKHRLMGQSTIATSIAKIKISGNIDNLFDRKYQRIYGYPEPGRKYGLNLTFEFK